MPSQIYGRRLDALRACAATAQEQKRTAFPTVMPTLEAMGLVTRRRLGGASAWVLTEAGRMALKELGMGDPGAPPAAPSAARTIADLRRARVITSHEIVAAIDAYFNDVKTEAYRFRSGHRLDIAAIISASPATIDAMSRPGPQAKAARLAVTNIVMTSQPTPP